MDKYLLIASAAFLTVAIAGCSSEGSPQVNSASSTPNSQPVAGQTLPTAPVTAAFKNPLVPSKQTEIEQTKVPAIDSSDSGLIPPTDAKQRLMLVTQSEGRPDPFAKINPPATLDVPVAVPIKPVPKIPTFPAWLYNRDNVAIKPVHPASPSSPAWLYNRDTIAIKPVHPAPPLSTTEHTRVASHPKPKPKSVAIASVLPNNIPPVIPIPKLTPLLPPPPEPNTAKAVTVTGVLLIGNKPEAIIKVPNEPTSRYVEEGQILLDGVLVKRIEMNQDSSPLVVFEQYGIEVPKIVGEKPITDANNNDNNTKPSKSAV